jgi:hypothetical protein
MDAPLDTPVLPRHDGAERRRAFGEYPGAERRIIDPATEQDHPELFYPQVDEVAVDPQQPAG